MLCHAICLVNVMLCHAICLVNVMLCHAICLVSVMLCHAICLVSVMLSCNNIMFICVIVASHWNPPSPWILTEISLRYLNRYTLL